MPVPADHYAKQCRLCRAATRNRCRHNDPLGVTPPGDPRLPFKPLLDILELRHRRNGDPFKTQSIHDGPLPDHAIAGILGGHHSQITEWRALGVRIHVADQIATLLHLHPIQIWGIDAWEAAEFADCPHATRPDPEPEEAAA